jgi:hypothetical protein
MKGVSNWIMVIGGVIIGLTLFAIGIGLLIRQIETSKRHTFLEQFQDFHGQLESICKMGLGHKKHYKLVIPDIVRAVYTVNKSYEPPPDKVSELITNRESEVGNYSCIQFFDDNLPICQYIGCHADMIYMGSPSLKPSLQRLLGELREQYLVYEYTIKIEKSGKYLLNVNTNTAPSS